MSRTHFDRWLAIAGMLVLFHASEARSEKVHVIVACDTSAEADLGGDVVADQTAVQAVFRENIPESQLDMQTILGNELSPQAILQRVNSLQVEKRRDAVVFYFTGHGAYDESRGHFFALPNRTQLLRSELENAIVAREPRRAVTMTDCCAGGARYRGKALPSLAAKRPSVVSPLFQHLLFDRCGFISITSSKPGEISLTRGDGKGSLFTYPFTMFMRKNADRQFNWETVLTRVASEVKADFKSVTKGKGIDTDQDGTPDQWTQTVHPFVLTPALGMRVQSQPEGLRITEIIPLSPAYQAGLETGDILLEINGAPVRTEAEYSTAVDRSPRTMRIKVRDHRQPRVADVVATLNQ